MRYEDLLDKFVPDLHGHWSCIKLNAKEMRMIRLALKTQDAINDALDEEISRTHLISLKGNNINNDTE